MTRHESIAALAACDALAASELLQQFDSYIDHLCTMPFVDHDGRVAYGVDLQMKSFLQGKLLNAAMKFRP